ncbi:MAG: cysteine desulfurase [Gammaproteobacteria bacterium]|nr:cysteine desulfurase [Gammaproteobacteria bacterium]MBL6998698.1 cysteine desulfurase [Gammaproteobacteria bacterium]
MAVYFDHNASTPLHPEVLEEMLPFMQRAHGNASSLHQSGRFLRSAIETARQRVAELVNCSQQDVIFTSGGTEANNLAIKGFVAPGSRLLSSQIEHASVLEPLQQMQTSGCSTHLFTVNRQGVTELEAAESLIQQHQPDLISLQLANNETGVVQPVQQIARLGHRHPTTLVHTDATQAVAKMAVDMEQLDVDMMTLSGHKMQGPQGAGALIVRRSTTKIKNVLISGGLQESSCRAGTENVATLVGFGKAAQLARINLLERQATLLELRRYFEQQLAGISGVQLFGDQVERLPNTSFFSIPFYHGETLLMQLDKAGFELASGSACHSEVTLPSHVLAAMGIDEDLALNAVRVSFGVDNTCQQIDTLIETLNHLINQLPAVMRQAAG